MNELVKFYTVWDFHSVFTAPDAHMRTRESEKERETKTIASGELDTVPR